MKAIIEVDVPKFQIGQEVSIYFKDTMMIKGVVQEPTEKPMAVDEMEREYEKSKALFNKIVECDDLISRQAVEEMISKGLSSGEYGNDAVRIITEVHYMPSVTPTQNCVENTLGALDCISRQAVLDVIEKLKKIHFDRVVVLNKVRDRVLELPSVTPQEPKTGHWIEPRSDDGMSDPIYYQVRCSECGFDLDPQTWHMELHQYGADKYCPKCGSKMYENKGVLEQLAEKQNSLSATNKAWSEAIDKNGDIY